MSRIGLWDPWLEIHARQDCWIRPLMFTQTIFIPWCWRWIGRFISLKFCLRLLSQDQKACAITVLAKDDSEVSEALVIHVPAGGEMPVSLYCPPETLSLILSSAHPFSGRLGLSHLELIKQALSLHQMRGLSLAALEDYWRKVTVLGGKLWVGRVLSLRKSRVNWVIRQISHLPVPLLRGIVPTIDVVAFTADRQKLLAAVRDVEGDFVILLHEKDQLLPEALPLLRQALGNNRHAVMIYSDHAVTDDQGVIVDVALKPSWNRLFQRDSGYIGRAVALRREQLLLALDANGAEEVDHRTLIEWVAAWVPKVMVSHVAKSCFLCHGETSSGLPPAYPPLRKEPLVSAVIPTRNGHDMLVKAVEALEKGTYRNVETIIVDHGSTDPQTLAFLSEFALRPSCRVIRDEGEFNFSRLMNLGFAAAQGELLLSLNNDVEMITPDWLGEMARMACLPSIGIVGARLLYPDDSIQHAGFMPDSVNDHWYRFAPADWPGFGNILRYRHLCLAVTGAVMLISRDAWMAAGPFNEEDFPVAFNDIDLCLKARDAGFDIAYTPFATLYHKESVTRGHDVTRAQKERQMKEFRAFRKRWGRRMHSDLLLSPHAIKQMWPMLGRRV